MVEVRGHLCQTNSSLNRRLQRFKQAIVVDNTAAEAYNNLARLYAGLGKDIQQAIDLAKHAVSLEPTARYYDTLAYTYYRNTQYAEASEAIHRALALAPDVDAYNKLLLKIQTAQKEK